MATMLTACVRAFTRRPLSKVASVRPLSTTITVSPSDVDDFNLEPRIAETIKALFQADPANALRLARNLWLEQAKLAMEQAMEREQAKLAMEQAMEREQAKQAMEREREQAKQAMEREREQAKQAMEREQAKQAMEREREQTKLAKLLLEETKQREAALKEERTSLLDVAKSHYKAAADMKEYFEQNLLKATSTVFARFIQEVTERKLEVGKDRVEGWKKVLKQDSNHDLLRGIHVHCRKCPEPEPGYKWSAEDIRHAANALAASYGTLSSGVHLPQLRKNKEGHIEIDLTNPDMCCSYQLGLKLHQLDPEIIVVPAPVPK